MRSKQVKKFKCMKCIFNLLTRVSAEGLAATGCKLLNWFCAIARLLDAPPLDITDADMVEGIGTTFELVGPETAWPVWPSTGFLERWRPLFMCLSQYFWSATASLEHRHFFPSVRRHLPGSGSVFPEKPRWKEPQLTTQLKPKNKKTEISKRGERRSILNQTHYALRLLVNIRD